MEETEFKGQWWLPEKNNPVGGVATYTPEDGVHLELFDRLDRNRLPMQSNNNTDRILGVTTENEAITLVQCMESGSSMKTSRNSSISPEEYDCRFLLKGTHIPVNNLAFDKMSIEFPFLGEWAELRKIQTKFNLTVRRSLSTVVDKLSLVHNSIIDYSTSLTSTHIEKLKVSLYITHEPWNDAFRACAERCVAGTGEWLFLDDKFNAWATTQNDAPYIFAIEAGSNFGKTYLSTIVIAHSNLRHLRGITDTSLRREYRPLSRNPYFSLYKPNSYSHAHACHSIAHVQHSISNSASYAQHIRVSFCVIVRI